MLKGADYKVVKLPWSFFAKSEKIGKDGYAHYSF